MKAATDSTFYHVPLIPNDLSREETMLRIADSLQLVDAIAEDFTRRIETRIELVQGRLKSVVQRLDHCSSKIGSIKGSPRATVVVAPSKFPIAGDQKSRSIAVIPQNQQFEVVLENRPVSGAAKPVTFDHRATMNEKQMYYNVRVNKKESSRSSGSDRSLGPVPEQITSVSNLLLFNTSINPYEQLPMDRSREEGRRRIRPQGLNLDEPSSRIGEAPTTITQSDYDANGGIGEYAYTPTLGDVPTFDVPSMLPDLEGIADLSYDALVPSIAPSGAITPNDSILDFGSNSFMGGPPSILGTGIEGLDGTPGANSSTTLGHPPRMDYDRSSQPPDSLIIPRVPDMDSNQNGSNVVERVAPAGSIPPPPPPPPPPPLVVFTKEDVTSSDSYSPMPTRPEADAAHPAAARNNLMDAIKEAGGSSNFKFRTAEEQKRQRKADREREKEGMPVPAPSSGPGDLMSDLSKALQLRRKGISGGNDPPAPVKSSINDKANLGSPMALLSNQIPEPTRKRTESPVSDIESGGSSWEED